MYYARREPDSNPSVKLCKQADAAIDTLVIPVDVTNSKEKDVNRLLECTVGCVN